jgi:hypothetical protein
MVTPPESSERSLTGYIRWLWQDAPRALRLEFLITILLIEALALATIVVLTGPIDQEQNPPGAEVSLPLD